MSWRGGAWGETQNLELFCVPWRFWWFGFALLDQGCRSRCSNEEPRRQCSEVERLLEASGGMCFLSHAARLRGRLHPTGTLCDNDTMLIYELKSSHSVVSLAGTPGYYSFRTSASAETKETAWKEMTVDGGACYICLDTSPPPIQSGCACRGGSGLAHIACLARAVVVPRACHSSGSVGSWSRETIEMSVVRQ